MKAQLRILLIEDDKYFMLHNKEILTPFGVIEEAATRQQAFELILKNRYDVIVTDMHLGDQKDGLEIVRLARGKGHAQIVVVSASDHESTIEAAYTSGAHHFLMKNGLAENMPIYLKGLQHKRDLEQLERTLLEEFPTQDGKLLRQIEHLVTSNWKGQGLLVTGPTGTGKSHLGKVLHRLCGGEKAPFVHLNCSEVAENLLESELFGHEKGSFTGAENKKIGKLKLADGGTLFLDEVGTMSLGMQQKLLKALDEKTFYPVGASKPETSRFTLITATCQDLTQMMSKGEFREDLYFRITGLKLHLPALAERPKDVPLLIKHFQKEISRKFVIRTETIEYLQNYQWPGNIRELRKVLIRMAEEPTGIVGIPQAQQFLEGHFSKPEAIETDVMNYIQQNGLRAYFQYIEKLAAEEALKRHDGKITACIKELKISSSAFYRIMQEHHLSL